MKYFTLSHIGLLLFSKDLEKNARVFVISDSKYLYIYIYT